MRRVLESLIIAGLAGCATNVEMPKLPDSHPAHVEAPVGNVTHPPALLSLHQPMDSNSAESSAGRHDHMQQRTHGSAQSSAMGNMSGGNGGMMSGPHSPDTTVHSHAETTNAEDVGEQEKTSRSGAIFRCPYHPEWRSAHMNDCLLCEKPLSNEHSSTETEEMGANVEESDAPEGQYTCTWHGDLKASGPGLCPICGLTLLDLREEAQ